MTIMWITYEQTMEDIDLDLRDMLVKYQEKLKKGLCVNVSMQ